MKKNCTLPVYYLTLSMLLSIFLLPSCNTSRLANNNKTWQEAGYTTASDAGYNIHTDEQTLAATPEETYNQEDKPAAASMRPDRTPELYAHPVEIIRAPITRTVTRAEASSNADLGRQVQKKISFPARMLMKSIAKKAEKLQKKDIKNTGAEKEINNRSYLLLGILLLAAGLVLVLVGNTTLLYILGSVASLAGLIFLLLAIL